MTTPDILCLGEPLVEFMRQPDGTDRLHGIGGDTSNAAIAAARQGASVGYLTALGQDAHGDAIIAAWEAERIDASKVHRNPAAPTGTYTVDPDPEERRFYYDRAGSAASLMASEDLPPEWLDQCKALHVSGITLAVSPQLRATALAGMDRVAGRGAVSLDTNLRLALWTAAEARAVLYDAMTRVSVAVTSIDDSAHLTGLSNPDEIIAYYQSFGPEIVIVTMGAEGCRIGIGPRRDAIPPAPADPVDSTGAGDSFSGAFLAWWLELSDPVEAARRAAVVAAGTVSGYGAVVPIPKRVDVLRALGQTD